MLSAVEHTDSFFGDEIIYKYEKDLRDILKFQKEIHINNYVMFKIMTTKLHHHIRESV